MSAKKPFGIAKAPSTRSSSGKDPLQSGFDWLQIARLVSLSRAIDDLEEQQLYPQKKIAYQFSARGHVLSQVLLGLQLNDPHDGVAGYYRSRPLLLALGLDPVDAFAGPLGKSGSYSDGRDIGVVCNLLSTGGATVLPMAGDVGSQYTQIAGWAESLVYQQRVLKAKQFRSAIAVAHGGEGSTITNGFWSALNIATTRKLPVLFFIEDNGYAISVSSDKQTPGGNIADNLSGFRNLQIIQEDGADPELAAKAIVQAVTLVRNLRNPVLLRLRVPRLAGHSGQDSQNYKSKRELHDEENRDPLPRLRDYLVPRLYTQQQWDELTRSVHAEAKQALEAAFSREDPKPASICKHVFSDKSVAKTLWLSPANTEGNTEGPRINMVEGIRKTLASELERNSRMLVFGEDIGVKGGVHAATMGLQEQFGADRVFDTSLSEEGIIGRAVGMALSGLLPVPEIQFRKYADAATEQLNNCGTIRWRTANKFSAPMVVRMPIGYSRRAGDPWHSVCGESIWAHQVGWQVVIPSNTIDAVGLLRSALRGEDPTFFFEHRALLDEPSARRAYPGDEFVIPLGKANIVTTGDSLTVVTWGAMVERCLEAASQFNDSVEVIDLRTIVPWDNEMVFASVKKTGRCLIVHEDTLSVGFGAEIAAQLADQAFSYLDAPVRRIAPPDIPIPYAPILMNSVIPDVSQISREISALLEY